MDLTDNAVLVFADRELQPNLRFTGTIPDDFLIARFLCWPNHSAEEAVENCVKNCGLAALIQSGDENYSFWKADGLFQVELLEIRRLEAEELQLTPFSCSFATVFFQASWTSGFSVSCAFSSSPWNVLSISCSGVVLGRDSSGACVRTFSPCSSNSTWKNLSSVKDCSAERL